MFTLDPSAMQLLVPLYNSPQRHCHDINHIYFSLSKLCEYVYNKKDLSYIEIRILTYAIWFHDAIYSPYPFYLTSNEKQSASLFSDWIEKENYANLSSWYNGSPQQLVNSVVQAIEATEHHLSNEQDKDYELTTYVMLDIDMAGFGRSFQEVYASSDEVFKEYESLKLPREFMLKKRIEFLESVLSKPRIYYTDYFHSTYEARARSNIAAVIELSEAELNK